MRTGSLYERVARGPRQQLHGSVRRRREMASRVG
jgi:hypothetical protein